ncbi:enoyl-CoA hydratase/isomerase family protein [Rhodococcus fascians]|uniref:enoyl-CoA hydratase/isomerase family protein n=1 Tax=Rhodococcoides fascians TaxID=1828 RepID=UPI00195C254C|nr:enoyl-CoA hydratase/isomerase family protein [Rhodococcus fascians]MBM7242538.1 enoyl-CoA hydratase/isomerase family protein [Rhodococcus fascians]MBY3812006.1 enoyl-CoA hydratase/isomerase family protein [Rhodococcus fascians]MBY3840686.1 enoyl-CoA hydratase/isomerase family protein [Rhodococcus fascians]MBY3848182.1 enoyl-CoA hydratase/isomerase family protein [Rhodococcus fascians]MBY3853303.1 enoyl-CoA hydratase/isomerase family protein [Rhodococcus fascians]
MLDPNHEETTLEVVHEGNVARVALNRPHARNAVDLALCIRLREVFETLDSDPTTRVVTISGNGPSFCAGADLKERKGKDEVWVRRRRIASFAAYAAIEACSKPVVALVHGSVVGSGGEIAMACDFIVGSTDATFRFPEAHWGTVGATQRLQRVVGKRRAKELLYTNRVIDAAEAERLGVLVRTVDPQELPATGADIAHRIASAPPLSMALTKRAIDLGAETDLDRGIRIEMSAIEQNLADGGWRSGIDRFLADHDDRSDR